MIAKIHIENEVQGIIEYFSTFSVTLGLSLLTLGLMIEVYEESIPLKHAQEAETQKLA